MHGVSCIQSHYTVGRGETEHAAATPGRSQSLREEELKMRTLPTQNDYNPPFRYESTTPDNHVYECTGTPEATVTTNESANYDTAVDCAAYNKKT